MHQNSFRCRVVIVSSIALAMVILILPLPTWSTAIRPSVVTLVLIYWWLALPERVGISTAFITGLILDAITGTLLGQHALILSTIAYLTLQFHQRIRLYPLWQQSLVVVMLLFTEQLLSFGFKGITGLPAPDWHFWLTPLVGGLLWPWLFVTLRYLRRRFQIN